ncbi:MAG: glycine betaine ABC transporter substrate-binding protein [Vicinamibacterales bacterium]
MRRRVLALGPWLLLALPAASAGQAERPIQVASKLFTESVVLGDMAQQLLQDAGVPAVHRRELGGSRVLWSALRGGEIDLYPEYTGTLREEMFKGRALPDDEALQAALAAEGLAMSAPLGFENTYAVGVRAELADRLGLRTVSDLAAHPGLRFGFSSEFLDRGDGWIGLRQRYGLRQTDVRGMTHELTYVALQSGRVDAIDLFSTDAEIAYYGLRTLEDDRRFFARYEAVWLYRLDLDTRAPAAGPALRRVVGRIDEATMSRLNAQVKIERRPDTEVAGEFLRDTLDISMARLPSRGLAARIWRRSLEHLTLVSISLVAAIVVAIPLGVVAARSPRAGRAIIAVVSVVQTLPSLALFVFMIPVLGIGARPAVAALFLYSLLPIVRNTYTGLTDIPRPLRESAEVMGLSSSERLLQIELPLAARAILAGVKTAAVINVGTATVAALIGAGGYGQPILTGIRLDDMGLILSGAVPAALLALVVQGLFELVERLALPRSLRALHSA